MKVLLCFQVGLCLLKAVCRSQQCCSGLIARQHAHLDECQQSMQLVLLLCTGCAHQRVSVVCLSLGMLVLALPSSFVGKSGLPVCFDVAQGDHMMSLVSNKVLHPKTCGRTGLICIRNRPRKPLPCYHEDLYPGTARSDGTGVGQHGSIAVNNSLHVGRLLCHRKSSLVSRADLGGPRGGGGGLKISACSTLPS